MYHVKLCDFDAARGGAAVVPDGPDGADLRVKTVV